MPRFFVAQESVSAEDITIVGDDVNHIKNVLRMREGEKLTLTCGRGIDYECSIHLIGDDSIICKIERETPVQTELPVEIVLYQALPKGDKMDLIVQKVVELGAAKIVPVKTKRCVVKYDGKKSAKKVSRWQEIARSAAKQSGRGIIPEITDIMTYDMALQSAEKLDTVLLPYEMCDMTLTSGEIIRDATDKSSIGIFIGPEGGFETSEVDQATDAGARTISLGKRILRTETAGLAILSILMFMIEDKSLER
ncbi:MAG: 16S rRNA (uracil(1498)-N(3))-methyltransferase [Eubacterium sp.]|nr:16S rRNA (uracil(1498)-N(3))-methyltransferase [Eubacterium sp.]